MKRRYVQIDPETNVSWLRKKLGEKGSVSVYLGLLIVCLFIFSALFGKYAYEMGVYPHSPTTTNYIDFDIPPQNPILNSVLDRRDRELFFYERDLPPDASYILGTDRDGRDIFIRVMNGSWTYLFAGATAVLISLFLGIWLGVMLEYFRNQYLKSIAGYITSVLDAFPRIVVLIIVAFIYNFNLYPIVIALGILNSTRIAQIVKNTIAVLKNSDFILAAKEMGLPDRSIILKHIVWFNCRHALLVQIVYGFASVILIEATLSYIGFGIGEPLVSWGNMILEGIGGRTAFGIYEGRYWQFIPPTAAILITILGLNLLADGLSKRFNIKEVDYI